MRNAVIIYGRENVIYVGKCMFQQILQTAAELRKRLCVLIHLQHLKATF